MSNDEVWDENDVKGVDDEAVDEAVDAIVPMQVESLKELLQSRGPQRLAEIDVSLDSNRTTVKLFRQRIAELVTERAELVRILNATTPRANNRKPTVDTTPTPKPARVRKPKPVTSDG